MLAGLESGPGDREMAIVRCRHANGVDVVGQKLLGGVGPGMTCEGAEPTVLSIAFGPRAGAASDGGQFDFDQAEVAAKEPFGPKLLEAGPIGFVEDHPQA